VPTVDRKELDSDATGGVLETPVLVDDTRLGDPRVSCLNLRAVTNPAPYARQERPSSVRELMLIHHSTLTSAFAEAAR